MDTISIVIPVLEPGDTLAKVLESLTTQTRLADEVILVDAGKGRKVESLVKLYSNANEAVDIKPENPKLSTPCPDNTE